MDVKKSCTRKFDVLSNEYKYFPYLRHIRIKTLYALKKMSFLKAPPPDLKCHLCGKKFAPGKGKAYYRPLENHMATHGDEGSKIISFKKKSKFEKIIPQDILPKKRKKNASRPNKNKRGGSKKGTTANFHTWKWRHARVEEYEKLPKGQKCKWLMKKGICRSNMSRWRNHFEKHEFDPHVQLRKQIYSKTPRTLKYAEAEKKLYDFYRRRRDLGYRTPKNLILTKFKQILREDDSNDPTAIEKISRTWLKRWMKDNKISTKRRTNRKGKSIYERMHQISNYHHFVIYNMADPNNVYPIWKQKKQELQEYGSDESEDESEASSSSEDTEEGTS